MDLDQFQTGLNLDVFIVQIGKRALQMALRLAPIARPLLRNSQQRLHPPQVGLKLQSRAHVWDRLDVFALKEQQYAEVSLSIDVFRVEQNDFAQHRNGELWFLFL